MAKHIFDFFNLPLELRDEIYQRLHEDIEVNQLKTVSCTIRTPVAHARSINRQFQIEYDKWTPRHHRLQVYHPWEITDIPPRAKMTTSSKIHLGVYASDCDFHHGHGHYCTSTISIRKYTNWITKFVQQLQNLETTMVVFGVDSPRCCADLWLKHHELENPPTVTEIRTVCFLQNPKMPGCFNDHEHGRRLAAWTPGIGLKVAELAVEECRQDEELIRAKHLEEELQKLSKSSRLHRGTGESPQLPGV